MDNFRKKISLTFACVMLLLIMSAKAFCQLQNVIKNLKIDTISGVNWQKFNYNELYPIINKLENYQILGLAESDHGDGTSLDAQCMILKALIDSGKVSIIYLEASWINLERMTNILKKHGTDSIKATYKYIRSSTLAFWVANGFWDYLAHKILDKKIKLVGIDIGAISENIVDEMFEEANKLVRVKLALANNKGLYDFANSLLKRFDSHSHQTFLQKNLYIRLSEYLDLVIEEYRLSNDTDNVKKWSSIKLYFYWLDRRSRVLDGNKIINQIKNRKQASEFHSVRDSIMASFFVDYYNQNKDAKGVAIMSTYHSLKNGHEIENIEKCCKGNDVLTVGEILSKKLPGKFFNIGFIKSTGISSVYYQKPKKHNIVPKPFKNSMEGYLGKGELDYAFIDLSQPAISNINFYMGIVFLRYLESIWSRNFNGVFYIKKMNPLNLVW